MKVFAYCCESFKGGTRKAAGVEPVTCPPSWAGEFDTSQLEGNDLIYFDLHGAPRNDQWYGDHDIVALTASQLARVDLQGTIVFALNCFLADEESPMLDALLEAGARYVVAGDGRNYAGTKRLFGASLLGLWFRRLLELVGPLKALALAKRRVRLNLIKGKRKEEASDTLAFRAFYRREDVT